MGGTTSGQLTYTCLEEGRQPALWRHAAWWSRTLSWLFLREPPSKERFTVEAHHAITRGVIAIVITFAREAVNATRVPKPVEIGAVHREGIELVVL